MVLKILTTLLLIPTLSFAQHGGHQCNHNDDGVVECLGSEEHKKPNDLANKYLEWWAANNYQVKNAKCRNAGAPTIKQMTDFINRKKTDKVVSDSFHGIKIENDDPHLIHRLKQLTTYDPLFSYDVDKSKQPKYTIPETCKKVLCAAESIFGKDRALKLLYALDRYELNLSHKTDDNLADWKASEIDLILESVDDLPAHLIPFERNQYLKHYKRGYGPSASTVANATITVFSVWEDLPSNEERMATIIHEIGHNIGGRLKQDESKEWLDMSGWVEKDGTWTSSKKDQIVSKYGLTNPAEDFAETFVAFRYNPALLKKMSPKKYEYMKKNVFLNLEYDTDQKCLDSNSTLAKLKEGLNIKEAALPEKYGACKSEIAQIFAKKDVDLKSCINKVKRQAEIEKKLVGKTKLEKDAILQALQFEEATAIGVSDEEEKEAYKKIIGDIYGSIAKEFTNFDGKECTSAKKYGWQDMMAFNKFTFQDEYSKVINHDQVNSFVGSLCQKLGGPEKIQCKKLTAFMAEHIPKRLMTSVKPTSSTLSTYIDDRRITPADATRVVLPPVRLPISSTQKVEQSKPANDFRCPM